MIPLLIAILVAITFAAVLLYHIIEWLQILRDELRRIDTKLGNIKASLVNIEAKR